MSIACSGQQTPAPTDTGNDRGQDLREKDLSKPDVPDAPDVPDTSNNQNCSYRDPRVVGRLEDSRITEVSGLTYSETQDVLWVHNDSGEETALFYALNLSGATVGTFELGGITPVDWEDMTNGVVDGTPVLFFADMGDNAARNGEGGRDNIVIYGLDEPTAETATPLEPTTVSQFRTYTFTYPDGARDCEALFYDSDKLYFLSKVNAGASSLYVAPHLIDGSTSELTKIGEVTFGTEDYPGTVLTTAGALSDDMRKILVRTYTSLLIFDWSAGEPFQDAFATPPTPVSAPREIQGEAADFAPNGGIYTISEGNLPDIHYLEYVCEP